MLLSLTPSPFDGTQLCVDADPDLFFTEETEADAIALCSSCWVKERCLSYALSNNETIGVWGGTTARERRLMKRRARK